MTDQPIKSGWRTYRFDQIAINVNDRVEPGDTDLEYYVGLEHLDSDSLKIRRWGSPDDVGATKLRFRKGDIIFGRRRVYQRKLAVADFDGICSAHAMVLRPKTDAVLAEFLPFFMQSDLFMNRALEISVGSLSPTINWKTLAAQEFPLPPLAEQRRIAEVLLAHRQVSDALRETIARQNALRGSMRMSLFSRGLNNGETKVTKALGTVPAKWSVVPLADLALGRYGIVDGPFGSNLKRVHYRASGHPVIQSAFVASGVFDPAATEYVYVDDAKIAEQKRSIVRPGDIVMVKIGVNCGACALLPEDHLAGILAGNCLKITPNPEICNTEYLLHYLHWLYDVGRLERLVNSTQQRALSIGRLRNQEIAFPELGEQLKVANILNAIEKVQRSLLNRLDAARRSHHTALGIMLRERVC